MTLEAGRGTTVVTAGVDRPYGQLVDAARIAVISGDQEASPLFAAADAVESAGFGVDRLAIDGQGEWWDGSGNVVGLAGAVRVLVRCTAAMSIVPGPYALDGTLAALCRLAGVPWIGSPPRACVLALDRWATRLVAEAEGVATPRGTLVVRDEARHISGLLAADLPLVVRPNRAGSRHRTSLVRTEPVRTELVRTEEDLVAALDAVFASDDRVLIEEAVQGREVSVAVLGRPDGTRMVAPALGPAPLEEAAISMYDALGCAAIARVRFLVTGDGPLLTGVDPAPSLAAGSPVPRMFAATGISYPQLLGLLVSDARRRDQSRPPVGA